MQTQAPREGSIDLLMPSAISRSGILTVLSIGLGPEGKGRKRVYDVEGPFKAYDLFKQNILHYKRVQPTAADHANEQRSRAGTARQAKQQKEQQQSRGWSISSAGQQGRKGQAELCSHCCCCCWCGIKKVAEK